MLVTNSGWLRSSRSARIGDTYGPYGGPFYPR
jgi:hypothetical protein